MRLHRARRDSARARNIFDRVAADVVEGQ